MRWMEAGIFSDIDFRSSYYRPDVIGGMIYPEGEYDQSIVNMLQSGLESTDKESEYVVTGLDRK